MSPSVSSAASPAYLVRMQLRLSYLAATVDTQGTATPNR